MMKRYRGVVAQTTLYAVEFDLPDSYDHGDALQTLMDLHKNKVTKPVPDAGAYNVRSLDPIDTPAPLVKCDACKGAGVFYVEGIATSPQVICSDCQGQRYIPCNSNNEKPPARVKKSRAGSTETVTSTSATQKPSRRNARAATRSSR